MNRAGGQRRDATPGRLIPGLAVVVLVGLSARGLHGILPEATGRVLGEVIFAVLLGLAVGNVFRLPLSTSPGIRFSFHTLLRAAIVLLGAGFSFTTALAIGGRALSLIVVLMALALVVSHLLGRTLGVPGRLATLIGVGTAVCGNSAISASAPVIGARDEEVAFAIATNTLFGTAAVFAYPLIGRMLGLSDPFFGTWAGTAVNDTSQVVATGFAYSEAAGGIATVVKLTRNALMGAVIVGLAFAYADRREETRSHVHPLRRMRESVPLFVVGFLAMALLNTLGAFEALGRALRFDPAESIEFATRLLILLALAGVGLSTRIEAMRSIGARPFAVGLAAATCTAVASYALIALIGPAGG